MTEEKKSTKKGKAFNMLLVATLIAVVFLIAQIGFQNFSDMEASKEVDQPYHAVIPSEEEGGPVNVKMITKEEADRLIELYRNDPEAYTKALEELRDEGE